uniref:ribosomal protein S19 n=1 Tax=Tetraselmis marina TaxID=41888 RepID=UPI00218256B8|nr:ribosomal protein S19 [Tetraselmis marina]UVF37909.1 ribosomal protein S19 [Tetraselmis marina]
MTRSIWKGPFVGSFFFRAKYKEKLTNSKEKPIMVYSRSSSILPQFVGGKFAVHNGKQFIFISVTEDMVGEKFGEFAFTKKRTIHKKKLKK